MSEREATETAAATGAAPAHDAAHDPSPEGSGATAVPGDAHDTVEAAVRAQLSKALGGVRGMIEAAVPTIGFTATYVAAKDIKLAVGVGVGAAVVLLALRVAQRTSVQFVLNSLVGIAIAAFFALRSGKAEDAFLPGIMLNAGYAAAMILSIVVRWPIVGFIIGSVTGDPTAWRSDPGIVRLCSRLTWLLVLPCALRVAVQYPIYLAAGDQSGLLGPAKIVMGWPLQVAALATMVWLLTRGRTPLPAGEDADEPERA
ncbi:DUF3159 domain-containing protein [Actinomadura nitritigenes]|uniref:DUF3159 domain-containing protein n=1 Tax=Actinomadura nitritigenes TaxID=134602 RepID=UPI003D8E140A